jgi:aminopeptidase
MADTLYDENFGGRFGNFHIALGRAYHDAFMGDPRKMKEADFKRLGYNDSVEHTDIISTRDRTVTAVLRDRSTRVIYEGGEFVGA